MQPFNPLAFLESGEPKAIEPGYTWMVAYTYPGPLPCSAGMSKGCSDVVDGGPRLGVGRFCDYMVVCAGVTVTIFYNRFAPVG